MPIDFLTTAEVSRYLQVHPTTVYKLVRNGQIPAFKIGADYRFDRDAIEKWMADRQVKGGPRKKEPRSLGPLGMTESTEHPAAAPSPAPQSR